jgi:hypothetical protein
MGVQSHAFSLFLERTFNKMPAKVTREYHLRLHANAVCRMLARAHIKCFRNNEGKEKVIITGVIAQALAGFAVPLADDGRFFFNLKTCLCKPEQGYTRLPLFWHALPFRTSRC